MSESFRPLKAATRAVAKRPDQLDPVSLRRFSRGRVGRNILQVRPAVLIPQECDRLVVRVQRNIRRIFDLVKDRGSAGIAIQSYSANSCIPADDHAVLSCFASAQNYGRSRANARQVHGSMSGSGESPVIAVWFFEQNGDISMRL